MNILFVCTGNTCRSPMAEGYLKSKNLPDVNVRSRGLSSNGEAVSKNSALAMQETGIDISGLVSEQINFSDIVWADKIICMSLSHKTAISLYTSPEKVFVLADGVPDPFGGDLEIYTECRNAITAAIDSLEKEGFFSEMQIMAMDREHIKSIAELEKICFSQPWSEETLLQAFMNGTKFFVAVQNSKMLGYIGISCIIDEGYIFNIAVFPEHRNKGVATALLDRVFSLAKDENLAFVSLEVRVSNASAINLYKKTGFKEEGRRPNFYDNPKEDALIMTKRFESI